VVVRRAAKRKKRGTELPVKRGKVEEVVEDKLPVFFELEKVKTMQPNKVEADFQLFKGQVRNQVIEEDS
jgi:hypothetical protein